MIPAGWPLPVRRCSHPRCRTSLDEHPIECPHGLPFCGNCAIEEGCADCDLEPVRAAVQAAGGWPCHVMTRSEELQGHLAEQRKDERQTRHYSAAEEDGAADDYYYGRMSG